MAGLLLPVGERRMSSWTDHQHRSPRSTEPGTDFYCPIGTPVYAPWDGQVYGWGNSISPATGRWVGLDLSNGMRFRAMHFSRIVLSRAILENRGFVRKGQLIAYSGASGYGFEDWSGNPDTGGAHTHVTLWPTQKSHYGYWWDNGWHPYTIDFMKYADTGSASGGGTGPLPDPETPIEEEDDEMSINTMYTTPDPKFKFRIGVGNDTSGLWLEYVTNDAALNTKLARQYKTGDGIGVSNSVFSAFRAAHQATRPQSTVSVVVGEE